MSGRLDPRSVAAREKLRAALLVLCEDRALSAVSVAELSEQAGVARKTFYQHYASVPALAREIASQTFLPVLHSLPESALQNPLSMDIVRHVLLAFAEQREHIAQVTEAFGTDLVIEVMQPASDAAVRHMLALQGVQDERRAAYLSSGATGIALSILRTWMERGFEDPPEEVLALVNPVLQAALEKFLELA